MAGPTMQTGVVGIFDILGYQAFLEHNDVSTIVGEVLTMFADLPKETHALAQMFGPSGSEIRRIADSIQPILFSDTIVLTCPCYASDSFVHWAAKWSLFSFQSSVIYRHMFDHGFAMRGAIGYGDYLLQGTCFAGRPLIKAYKHANTLDAAAIVLLEDAAQVIRNRSADRELVDGMMDYFFFPFPVAVKGGSESQMLVLDVGRFYSSTLKTITREWASSTRACFGSHGREITPALERKIRCTEAVLDHTAVRLSKNLDDSSNRSGDIFVSGWCPLAPAR